MKSAGYDELDRKLLHALHLDGRAPFSRIAQALGVSDQTIARRYAKLRTQGGLRVMVAVEPAMLGYVKWMVRAPCKPEGAERLGNALARREDTSWVSLVSGGTELSCTTWSLAGYESNSTLLARLPNTPGVLSMSAQCILHIFYGGSRGLTLKTGSMTGEEIKALNADPLPDEYAPGDAEPLVLDAADRRLLAVLGRDGRAELAELAAATGWSQSTVRRRLAQLIASRAAYLDIDYDQGIYGLGTRVGLWLAVAPSELVAAGEELATHPEVAYACATTGATNLYAVLLCKDLHSLYTYLTTRVAVLGVRQVETSPIMRTLKGPAVIHDGSSMGAR